MKSHEIIDSHNHLYKAFTIDEMLQVLKKYNISRAIVSDVSGENGFVGKRSVEQTIVANRYVYDMVKSNRFLVGQFFYDCRYDEMSSELAEYLLVNKNTFVAIKIHAHISQTAVNSEKYFEMYKFAEEEGIPVMFHTDESERCNMQAMQEVINNFPKLKVVLGHAFLGVPALKVVQFLKRNKEVYADTSWADCEKIETLLKEIPSNRLMFGTDAPVDGEFGRGTPLNQERSGFAWYKSILSDLMQLSDKDYNAFMCDTAKRVYGI